MLSWLSQAVRVGAQCELKTIKQGVAAAWGKQEELEGVGGALVEGSVLVLVEPGLYEEERVVVDDDECVSIWRCDRESESNKEEMQKVEWRCRDDDTLITYGDAAAVSVNGMHMSVTESEGYDGDGLSCVAAGDGATLSLEGCDLTCESNAAVAQFLDNETTGVMFGCCIHDGKKAGVLIRDGASATLENNTITNNDLGGVLNAVHSTATLTGNAIKGNGQCKIEQTEEELAGWPEVIAAGASATLENNRIHDGKGEGVVIAVGASATLENNTITDNDHIGVIIGNHATTTLTGNTIKGNGQCKIERTEEELAVWSEAMATVYRSPGGFPGVRVLMHSTVTMPSGSNTIEGNGKVGSSGEQVMVDEMSRLEA
jgi:parallel beta-helix repeat protein